MNITEFRTQYPQYSDVNDMDLARKLHAKNYSDMDFSDFANKFGVAVNAPTTPKIASPVVPAAQPAAPQANPIIIPNAQLTPQMAGLDMNAIGRTLDKSIAAQDTPSMRSMTPQEQPSTLRTIGETMQRPLQQYLNKTLLTKVQENRPVSTIGGGLGTLSDAFGSIDAPDNPTFLDQLKIAPKLWWAITKGSLGIGTDKAKQEVIKQAIKQNFGTAEINVPEAKTKTEKAIDIGAGIGAFITELAVAKKLIPAGTVLSDAIAWEMVGRANGDLPGQGAVTGGALGRINQIPASTLIGKAGKVAAEGGLFAGITAAQGGTTEDILVAAALPAVLKGIDMLPGEVAKTETGRQVLGKTSMAFPKTSDAMRKQPSPEAVDTIIRTAKAEGIDITGKDAQVRNAARALELEVAARKQAAAKAAQAARKQPTQTSPIGALENTNKNAVSEPRMPISPEITPENAKIGALDKTSHLAPESTQIVTPAATPVKAQPQGTQAGAKPIVSDKSKSIKVIAIDRLNGKITNEQAIELLNAKRDAIRNDPKNQTDGFNNFTPDARKKLESVRIEITNALRDITKNKPVASPEISTSPAAEVQKTVNNSQVEIIAKEAQRVAILHNEAIKIGKRSKSKANIDKLVNQTGLDKDVIEKAVGNAYLSSLNADYGEIEKAVQKVINKPVVATQTAVGEGQTQAIDNPASKADNALMATDKAARDITPDNKQPTREQGVLEDLKPLTEEARKYKTANEFAESVQRESNISQQGKIQSIELNKIQGTDYPELDEAIASGKSITLKEINGIVPNNELMSKNKQVVMPIEVLDNGNGTYSLMAGNHRVAQQLINGKTTILANIQNKKGQSVKSQLIDIWNKSQSFNPPAPEDGGSVAKSKGTKPAAESAKQPELWQMTRAEFKDMKYGKSDPTRKISRNMSNLHRASVSDAIKAGEPVPAEVLKDYPELVKAEKTVATLNESNTPTPTPTPTPKNIATANTNTEINDAVKAMSARQADVQESRKQLGLDTIASQERKSWQISLDNAKSKGIPEKAQRIATEVNDNPRALSDEETAGLVVKASDLKTEYSDLMDRLSKISDSADIKTMSAEAERIEIEFDNLSRAIHLSGTEKGRALAAQKLTIDQSYDLISVVTRAKAAKSQDLTPKEKEKFKQITTKLDSATKKIDELQYQINEMKAHNFVKEGSVRRYKRMSLADKDNELSRLVNATNTLLEEGCYN